MAGKKNHLSYPMSKQMSKQMWNEPSTPYVYSKPPGFNGTVLITIGGMGVRDPPDDANLKNAVQNTGARGIIYDMEGFLGAEKDWKAQCRKYISMFPGIWHIACPLGHGWEKPNSPDVTPQDAEFTHIAPMAYGGSGSYTKAGAWTQAFVKGVYDKTAGRGWKKSQTFLTFQSASIASVGDYGAAVAKWLVSQKSQYAGLLGWGSSSNAKSAQILQFSGSANTPAPSTSAPSTSAPTTTTTTPAAPPNPGSSVCPAWVKGGNYEFNPEEWGGDGTQVRFMRVGQHDMDRGAQTTACTWVSQCKGDADCIKQCPVALGIAYNESGFLPTAQSSDGVGRGLFQIGGGVVCATCRGFTGPQCAGNGAGGGAEADASKCTAYDPLKNTEWTMKYSNNGKNFHPTGAAWWSCNNGIGQNVPEGTLKALRDPGFSKEKAINACTNATKDLQSTIKPDYSNMNWSCQVGAAANGITGCSCNGEDPARRSKCPGGGEPFSDTPNPGECSCGKDWADANKGHTKCSS